MRIEKTISSLTLFTIYFIPIIGFIDFLISIGVLPGAPGRSRPDHPFPQMIVAKEMIALLILGLLLVLVFKKMRVHYSSFMIFIVMVLLTAYSGNMNAMIAGIRQSVPFVYIVAGVVMMHDYSNRNINAKFLFLKALKIILVAEFILVLIQSQFMVHAYEGEGLISMRLIGSFNNPNTLGGFGALSVLLMYMMKSATYNIHKIYYIISGFLVFSAGSRLAIVMYVALLMVIMFNKMRTINSRVFILLLLIPMFIFTLLSINFLANKPDSVSILEGARASNFINYLISIDFLTVMFGQGWGKMTTWYFALVGGSYTDISRFMKLDSFYASMLAQLGIVGMILIFIFLFSVFLKGGNKGLYLFIIFCMFGAQINVLEFYPISFMIFLALGILYYETNISLGQMHFIQQQK